MEFEPRVTFRDLLLPSLCRAVSELLDVELTIARAARRACKLPAALRIILYRSGQLIAVDASGRSRVEYAISPLQLDAMIRAGVVTLRQPHAREVARIRALIRARLDGAQ